MTVQAPPTYLITGAGGGVANISPQVVAQLLSRGEAVRAKGGTQPQLVQQSWLSYRKLSDVCRRVTDPLRRVRH